MNILSKYISLFIYIFNVRLLHFLSCGARETKDGGYLPKYNLAQGLD